MNKKDLKDMDKVTFRNKRSLIYVLEYNGFANFTESGLCIKKSLTDYDDNLHYMPNTYRLIIDSLDEKTKLALSIWDVIRVERPEYKTIYGHTPVLDNKEIEYIENLIKPFSKKVRNIVKGNQGTGYECIVIYTNNDHEPDIILPKFKSNSMYKKMELNKPYTLKQLGIEI